MEFPESVLAVVREASANHPDDISEATGEAMTGIRALPEYESFVTGLLCRSLRELIQDDRHRVNVEMRRRAGLYGQSPKVKHDSPVLQAVYRSVYAYHIGGTTLGELTGEQIVGLKASEQAIAQGHLFNVELLDWLEQQGVVGDKCVKEVVAEKKLKAAFERICKRVQDKRSMTMAGV